MKIIVLGGSPKGDQSVTMQYVEYMRRRRDDVDWEVHQPALRIRRLEQDRNAFDAVIDDIHGADAILWAFPLYVHGVCSQYQRFIELVDERNAGTAFKGKPAAALTTSIKFFDHTAHDYIQAVSEDLEMTWIGSHSAHMNDLTSAEGKKAMDGFIAMCLAGMMRGGIRGPRQFPVVPDSPPGRYEPASPSPARRLPEGGIESKGKRIAVVADSVTGSLGAMIDRFTASFTGYSVHVTDLNAIRIGGGCLGCLKCGPKNQCAWDGRDDVRLVYEERVEPADLYVIATTVKGRWHSALMKTFIDRGFYHTHQPFLHGKQMVVLLDGSPAVNPPLRDYLKSFAEWQGAGLAGILAGDDVESADRGTDRNRALDGAIDALAATVTDSFNAGYIRSKTFLGVAGMTIFRDEIFSHLRAVFRADHKSYRKSGVYRTMIHKRPWRLLGYRLAGMMTAVPFIQARMTAGMRSFMLMPYRTVLAKTVPMEGCGD